MTTETIYYKMVVFRMPEQLKQDFRVALMKSGLDVQHTMEAFAERFIAHSEGEKCADTMKAIIKRAEVLMKGA